MAKLICVFWDDKIFQCLQMSCFAISRRQLQLIGGENLMMLMDLNSKGLVFDHPSIKGKLLDEFTAKYNILSQDELKSSLEVSSTEFTSVVRQNVPCVGCRRSVERLFYQLMLSGHPTLDPIVITSDGVLTISEEKLLSPQSICTLLHKHNVLLDNLLDNQTRNKKNSRCSLHSLDAFRLKPFSEIWKDVWNAMKQQCKDDISIIEAEELHTTLDSYLKKHKFCQDCRTKVEKAYALLMCETNPNKEKGYVPAIFSGLKRCKAEKHIHVHTKTEFIDSLIKRAEPELIGSNSRHRERHAKTLEIAQEEVLTCIGMCVYERLRRIYVALKEEENACQVLAAVAVHALSRNFDMAVDKKRGISNLELLYEEISRTERAKEQKKEMKKLKKKKKKNAKRCLTALRCHDCEPETCPDLCTCSSDEHNQNDEDEEIGSALISICCTKGNQHSEDIKDAASISSCHSCENINGGCTKSIDGGYVSEPSCHHEGVYSSLILSLKNSRTSSIISSPEGSEVACSDGFCNHDQQHFPNSHTPDPLHSRYIECNGMTSTLQQLLNDSPSEDESETSYIPDDQISDFKTRHKNIQQLREILRENLRKNFDKLCLKHSLTSATTPMGRITESPT